MNIPVLVFARAPVLGRVKTRLAASIGAWAAARLHLRLARHALRIAREARCGSVELHATAAHGAFWFQEKIFFQKGNDLGERMYRALRRHRRAILIGSDCPALTARDLRRAARMLCAGYRVVLAPAEDGGYALIAARNAPRALFEGIDWGGTRVYADTVRKFQNPEYRWRALRTVWDVDRPADVKRLAASPSRLRALRSS